MTLADVVIAVIIAGCGILFARAEQRRMDRRARFKDVDEYIARSAAGRDC